LLLLLWDWDGTLERLHHTLYVAWREQEGREASPTAAIIDSQSAKAAQKGDSTLDPQAFDAGKKVTGRKRHILALGLLLKVVVHPADVQDRDGARLVLDRRTLRLFPFIKRIFADAGYQGAKTAAAIAKLGSWRSSNATSRIASSFCPSAGLSSARSHGLATTAALRETSSAMRDPQPPSFAST
jgi:transposase